MMRNDRYPAGTTQDLLQSDLVTPQTKRVLEKRLNAPVVTEPLFFTIPEFATLQAVCNRLLPQPAGRKIKIDIAGILDVHLKEGKTANGWRYNEMPPDEEAFHKGLQGIEETAQIFYGKAFQDISVAQQDEILISLQQQKATGESWKTVPSHLFFEELLAALVEIYYSHPTGKEEIGDVSFADAKGWQHIELNERQETEPKTVNINQQ